jgi:ATP-binding cassette subfamily B protein
VARPAAPPLRALAGAIQLVRAGARGSLRGLLVLQGVGALALLLELVLLRQLLGYVLAPGGETLSQVLPAVVGLVVLLGVNGYATSAQSHQQRMVAELVEFHVLSRVAAVATSLELNSFDQPAFHDHLARTRDGALRQPYMVASGLFGAFNSLLNIAAIGITMLLVQPLLLLFLLVAYVPVALAAARRSGAIYDFSVANAPVERERAYLFNLLTGRGEAKELRAYGLQGFLRARHERLVRDRIAGLRAAMRRRAPFQLVASAGAALMVGLAIGAVALLMSHGLVKLAAAGAAMAGIVLLGQRLRDLSFAASQLYESALFVGDLQTFLALRPHEIEDDPRPEPLAPFQELRVEGVGFAYAGAREPALSDVSLLLRAGEVVAVVGPNGSGKTTLAKLLCGLYPPSTGTIRWDGMDLAAAPAGAVQRSVAVIFQDFLRYLMSAYFNIAVGDQARFEDDPGVHAAAARAGADTFLEGLPGGYATILGPEFFGGTDLSIGQWQRVALSRAFFREASLLVLDEPTAALDPEAEHTLFRRLRELAEGRSMLLISHRFSSVREADRIYVMDGGRAVESGTHEALLALGGLYARMFRTQAAAYLD